MIRFANTHHSDPDGPLLTSDLDAGPRGYLITTAEGTTHETELPPQLATVVKAAFTFTQALSEFDLAAYEVEAEELSADELAHLVHILARVRADLHDALSGLEPAVRLHRAGRDAPTSLAQALVALGRVGDQLGHTRADLSDANQTVEDSSDE